MTAFLPWGDSLYVVTKIASWAEIIGISCLAVTFVASVISYFYGTRKEELIAAAYQEQMASAARELTNLRRQQAQRTLSDAQQQLLIERLSPYQSQKISVVCVMGDSEAKRFASEFAEIFVQAGWVLKEPGLRVAEVSYVNDPVGIVIALNEGEMRADRFLVPALVLVDALKDLRVSDKKQIFADPGVPAGEIEIRVGSKAPLPVEEKGTEQQRSDAPEN